VHWVLTSPYRNFILLYTYDKQDPAAVHSLRLVTSSKGQKFIAGFTIEQLGFSVDIWFMDKQGYLDICALDGHCETPDAEFIDSMDECFEEEENEWSLQVRKVVREICGGADEGLSLEELR
jgi:hypothetical protein